MLEEDQSAEDVDEYELLAELEDDIETNLDHVLKNLQREGNFKMAELWGLDTLEKALKAKNLYISREALCYGGKVECMYDELTSFMCANGCEWATTTGWEMLHDLPDCKNESVIVKVDLEVTHKEIEEDHWIMEIKKLDITLEEVA